MHCKANRYTTDSTLHFIKQLTFFHSESNVTHASPQLQHTLHSKTGEKKRAADEEIIVAMYEKQLLGICSLITFSSIETNDN